MATASPDGASPDRASPDRASPDSLRREIEATRARLGANLDQIAGKVSPKRVVAREARCAAGAVAGLTARVRSVPVDVTRKVVRGSARGAHLATGTAETVVGLVWARTGRPSYAAAGKISEKAGQTASAVRARLAGALRVE